MRDTFSVKFRKRIAAAIAAAAICLPLAACSSAASNESADYGMALGPQSEAMVDRVGADGGADMASGFAADSSMASAAVAESARSIISSGSIFLQVDDPAASAEEVASIAKGLGGYVESQNVSGNVSERASDASLSIRVPSSKFDEAFDQLGELGKVLDEGRSATDVTAEHVDLQARVKSLQTSVDRLTELMAGAATTSELIEAESALAARQADLDSLKAQLESLEGQVDEATIWVQLTEDRAIPGGPANFWEGLLAGLQSLTVAAAGALVVLGVLLPWIVIAAIIALIIVLIVRASKKRRRARSERQAAQQPAVAQAQPSVESQPTTTQQASPPTQTTNGSATTGQASQTGPADSPTPGE